MRMMKRFMEYYPSSSGHLHSLLSSNTFSLSCQPKIMVKVKFFISSNLKDIIKMINC